MEEISPPVHIGEMDEAALVTVEIGDGASSIFMGSGLCFGRVTGLKGEGEMRSEEIGRE